MKIFRNLQSILLVLMERKRTLIRKSQGRSCCLEMNHPVAEQLGCRYWDFIDRSLGLYFPILLEQNLHQLQNHQEIPTLRKRPSADPTLLPDHRLLPHLSPEFLVEVVGLRLVMHGQSPGL